jgi:hypothetical protein
MAAQGIKFACPTVQALHCEYNDLSIDREEKKTMQEISSFNFFSIMKSLDTETLMQYRCHFLFGY